MIEISKVADIEAHVHDFTSAGGQQLRANPALLEQLFLQVGGWPETRDSSLPQFT